MPKKNSQQGQDDSKPQKPKAVAKVVLTIYDDGQITDDYIVYEKNAVEKTKAWTLEGTDFIKYLRRIQARNVPTLATCFNVLIARAGLPEELQGQRIKVGEDGKMSLALGNFVDGGKSPVASIPDRINTGERVAIGSEVAAAKAIGLSPADIVAAVPGANP